MSKRQVSNVPPRPQNEVRGVEREIEWLADEVGVENRFRFEEGTEGKHQPEVRRVDWPEWGVQHQRLSIIGVIEEQEPLYVEYKRYESGTRPVRTWALQEWAAEAAREICRDKSSMLPCGHSGISNPRGVDGYQCLFDGCDAVFSREEVDR